MRSKLGSALQGAVSCSETFHGMLSDEVILSKRITGLKTPHLRFCLKPVRDRVRNRFWVKGKHELEKHPEKALSCAHRCWAGHTQYTTVQLSMYVKYDCTVKESSPRL